jgi:hypothetical protein
MKGWSPLNPPRNTTPSSWVSTSGRLTLPPPGTIQTLHTDGWVNRTGRLIDGAGILRQGSLCTLSPWCCCEHNAVPGQGAREVAGVIRYPGTRDIEDYGVRAAGSRSIGAPESGQISLAAKTVYIHTQKIGPFLAG